MIHEMAPFDGNILTRVALIGVLIGIFMTDSTIACSTDFTTCRYDCPAEVVQEHCTSENEGHCAVDGKCCPGFFRTKNSCQVCPDVHFMPDVNSCCECLPCAECDDIQNNTVVVPCSHTSNTVCTRQNDPPSRAPSDCPWIQSTTQVPTSEAAGVNTPMDPQESISERTFKAAEFYTIIDLFYLSLLMILLLCIYIYKKCIGIYGQITKKRPVDVKNGDKHGADIPLKKVDNEAQ